MWNMDYTPPAAPPPVKYQKLACGYFSELTLYIAVDSLF